MRYALAITMCVLLSGCSLIEVTSKVEKAGAHTDQVGETAGNVLNELENATGKDYISDDTAAKGEKISGKAGDIAAGGQTGLKVIAPFVPEKHKPLLGLIDGILALTVVASGSLAAFFRRQKKQSDKIALSAITAVDEVAGAGALITSRAKAMGIADDVESLYKEAAAIGAVGSK